MKLVADTDILSIFSRIDRLDILNELFEAIIVSPSVKVELAEGKIDLKKLGPEFAQLTTGELKDLKYAHSELDKGEKECYIIAKNGNIPLASNEKIVHRLCREDNMNYFSLPRILRLAIKDGIVTRNEARQLVNSIEKEEHTVIKNKDEIFR
ncbi:MAG: hypothetical protein KGI02_06065 [Thaumarchaeota archaeon]|nr:hypothetical protein [Nitrososphaerota archaeon]